MKPGIFFLCCILLLTVCLARVTAQATIQFDTTQDGTFTQLDLTFWAKGYALNVVDPQTLIYLSNTVPANGMVRCPTASKTPCLLLPLSSDDTLKTELFRRFSAQALGAQVSEVSASNGGSMSSLFSHLLALISRSTGYQVSNQEDNSGYTPPSASEMAKQAKEELADITKQGKETLTNPVDTKGKPTKEGISAEQAQDFLSKVEQAIKDNPPSKPYDQLSKSERKQQDDTVKDKVMHEYGFSSKAEVLAALANPFASKERKDAARVLKNVEFNSNFNSFTDRKAPDLYRAIGIIVRYQPSVTNEVGVARPQPRAGGVAVPIVK